jgi:hypothetical protein
MITFLLGVLTGAAAVYAWGAVLVFKRKVIEALGQQAWGK